MLNKIILIGRMTKDPEQRGKDPEKPIAYFRIAVDRDFKRDGESDTDFFDCSVFGQQAKFVLQYGRKGRLVCVVGAMQHREWQDQQTGKKRTAFEVVRVEVHFLDKKPDDVQSGNPARQRSLRYPISVAYRKAMRGGQVECRLLTHHSERNVWLVKMEKQGISPAFPPYCWEVCYEISFFLSQSGAALTAV